MPILFERGVVFKFAVDTWITGELNSKLWPRESAGKFITVYPSTVPEFLTLGEELAEALRSCDGPYILSDRRWPSSRCVFYRYGGFRDRSQVCADGSRRQLISSADGTVIPDLRKPYFHLPQGIADPCQQESGTLGEGGYVLNDGRYRVTAALNFTSRGGVYTAVDQADNTTVILKEARPLVEIGTARASAVQVLDNEYRLLLELSGTGGFVEPLDFFQDWEHHYLVEAYVRAATLAEYIIAHNPIYNGSCDFPSINLYLNRITAVWLKIARAIRSAHDRGIVLGDLSITNVMVDEDDDVTIVDLEGARFLSGGSIGLFTPGFTTRSAWTTGIADKPNDLYGLGGIMFASLAIANTFVDYYPDALPRFLDELQRDMGIPASLVELIGRVYHEENVLGATIDEVIDALEEVRRDVGKGITAQPRLAWKVEAWRSRENSDDLCRATRETLDRIIDFARNSADLSRRDRLFPADKLVFATNPLSVAYGASGVLHLLRTVTGEVDPELVHWVLAAPMENYDYPPGLYLGKSGIAWVLDDIGHTERAQALLRESGAHPLLWTSADVLHGAAGFGLACLKFWFRHRDDAALCDAVAVGDWLLVTALRQERGVRWPSDDGTLHLGYARGGTGVALFLLYLSLATGDGRYRRVGRDALALELHHAEWKGKRFLGFPEEPKAGPSPYWAAGTAGVVSTLVRYGKADPEEDLGRYIHDFEGDLCHKYAKFPQLFRGLAGMGNCLLDLWHFSRDEKYVSHAWRIATGVLLHRISRPEGVSFPGARGLRESADLATGAAGVGLFLHRLLAVHDGSTGVGDFNFTLDDYCFRD
jgi:serine/threonine protein kinase